MSSFRRSDGEAPLFREATSEAGIDFIHRTEPPGSFFFPEVNGSGAAFLDFDLDGDLDIYLVNLGTGYLNPGVGEASDGRHTNRLYEQIGIGRFEDVTAKSGLGDAGYGTGVAVGEMQGRKNRSGCSRISACSSQAATGQSNASRSRASEFTWSSW